MFIKNRIKTLSEGFPHVLKLVQDLYPNVFHPKNKIKIYPMITSFKMKKKTINIKSKSILCE
jgi:hypothetical protein